MKTETMVELLNKLKKDEILYFFLASTISADSTRSKADCEYAIELLKKTKEAVPESELTDSEKTYVEEFCEKGINICETEKKRLENIN